MVYFGIVYPVNRNPISRRHKNWRIGWDADMTFHFACPNKGFVQKFLQRSNAARRGRGPVRGRRLAPSEGRSLRRILTIERLGLSRFPFPKGERFVVGVETSSWFLPQSGTFPKPGDNRTIHQRERRRVTQYILSKNLIKDESRGAFVPLSFFRTESIRPITMTNPREASWTV